MYWNGSTANCIYDVEEKMTEDTRVETFCELFDKKIVVIVCLHPLKIKKHYFHRQSSKVSAIEKYVIEDHGSTNEKLNSFITP